MQRIRLAVGMTMFIDGLLYLVIFPLLPVFSEQFDLSKLDAAVLLSGYQVAFVITAIPAGWLAGRFGPRRVVLGGLVFFILASLLFAIAPSFALLVAARGLQGIAAGCGWSAAMSWLTENTERDRRSRAVGLISGVSAAGAVAGPVIGALAAATSVTLAFGIVAVMGLGALVMTLLAPPGQLPPTGPPLRTTVRRLIGHPTVIAALCFSFTVSICLSTVDLLAILALGDRGVDATTIGVILSAGAVLGVVTGTIVGRVGERIGSFGLCLVGAFGMALLTILLALPLPTWGLGVAIVLVGPLFPFLMTGIYPLAASASDDFGLGHGTANGVVNICWTGATALVPLAAAWIADAEGDAAAYLTATVLTLGLIAIALLMRSRARNLSLSH
ncbi:MAG: MFS transporter [Gaiellales bacterium]